LGAQPITHSAQSAEDKDDSNQPDARGTPPCLCDSRRHDAAQQTGNTAGSQHADRNERRRLKRGFAK
jgi:hypothetical protein